MRHMTLPAGAAIRLTATAPPGRGLFRWSLRLFADAAATPGEAPRLAYGSEIGGRDCEQRIDVPMQDRDCRLEVGCDRAVAGGWAEDAGRVEQDTPSLLVLGFGDGRPPVSATNEVVLSFAFSGPARSEAGR